jgi:Domain of unknown function (DUF1854)
MSTAGSQPPVSLTRDAHDRLVGTFSDGRQCLGVVPVRCFPFSQPRQWISLCDEHGKELVLVESLDLLAPAEQALIEEELSRREFMPIILRIDSVTPDSHPSEWQVQTDRGARELTVLSEDHIHSLEPHGAIVTDAQGIRYRVVDSRALDARSRSLLGRHL